MNRRNFLRLLVAALAVPVVAPLAKLGPRPLLVGEWGTRYGMEIHTSGGPIRLDQWKEVEFYLTDEDLAWSPDAAAEDIAKMIDEEILAVHRAAWAGAGWLGS